MMAMHIFGQIPGEFFFTVFVFVYEGGSNCVEKYFLVISYR